MNTAQTRTIAIFAALAALMAATRFNHFGSAISLPDASYAVFFLGGLYLAGSARSTLAMFVVLLCEAGLIDYYATSVRGISDWCMSPAYWFLIPAYGSLWLAGRSVGQHGASQRHAREGRWLAVVILAAWAAGSFAFAFSNAAFYLFSGYFADIGAAEYASRVAQYYLPYVSVALLYVCSAVALDMAAGIVGRPRAHH